MPKDNAVIVKDLYKSFRIPLDKASGIKQLLVNFHKRNKGYRDFHVLNDINFEIQKGEFFGIVGRNGSGKSTLLKLLAGIYTPDKGLVHISGSLTPFIELGVGFNPELTAHENVYLNGALLGFSRDEINEMYAEIVEFAELGDFMAEKLKNFSSGMQVRLAFSIAIRARSEILIMDEVLAVGDSEFQTKCFNYFNEIKKDPNKTVILVTHDMSAVRKFCTKALVIDNGRIEYIGNPEDAASRYREINFPSLTDTNNDEKKLTMAIVSPKTLYKTGEEIVIDLKWDKSLVGVKNAGVAITSTDGIYVFGANTIIDKIRISSNTIRYKIKLSLGTGIYNLSSGIFGDTDSDVIYFNDKGPSFQVINNSGDQGLAILDHEWE